MRKSLDGKALIESLAKRYSHLPDESREKTVSRIASLYDETKLLLVEPGFTYELLNGDEAKFQQRYWEMLLAYQLGQTGARLTHERSGPDFCFELDGRKIWIEAVAPNRSPEINDYYNTEILNRGGWIAADIFALRWTQAITQKIEKFGRYLNKGQVRASDICVIAVNSGLLGSLGLTGKSDHPVLIDVVFGTGAEYALIDVNSMTIVEQGRKREPTVTNKNGSAVSKQFFMDANAQQISAILASAATPEWPTPFIAAYNPLAVNSLRRGQIGAEREYYAEDCGDHLEVRTERRLLQPREANKSDC